MIGVLLLKEMNDLTDAEALFNLDFNLAWHVALVLRTSRRPWERSKPRIGRWSARSRAP